MGSTCEFYSKQTQQQQQNTQTVISIRAAKKLEFFVSGIRSDRRKVATRSENENPCKIFIIFRTRTIGFDNWIVVVVVIGLFKNRFINRKSQLDQTKGYCD